MLFALCVEDDYARAFEQLNSTAGGGSVSTPLPDEILYRNYIDIALMMFVGFGYLMTFLQWYGLGAVGYTMLITSVCVLCSILLDSFFAQLYAGKGFHAISLSMTSLIDGNFAAAALLITFGALIGKAGPLQLLLLALLEVIVYNANLHLLLKGAFGIADIGGTIIHNLGVSRPAAQDQQL